MDVAQRARRAAPKTALFSSYSEFYQNSAYAKFPQDTRSGGSYAQTLVMVEQEPIDLIDAALPDFVLTMALTNMHECSVDVGDGLQHFKHAKKHTMMIYPAHTEVRTRVTTPHSIMSLSIPQTNVSNVLDRAGLSKSIFGARVGHLFEDEAAACLVKSIWRAATSKTFADDLLIDGLTLQLLAHLARQTAESQGSCERLRKGSQLSAATLANIDVYIDEHINSSVRVGDLALLARMSEFHFIRCFKEALGETPYRYILRRRLDRAKQLISNSNFSLAQISYDCGFSSQSHMSEQFRRHVGVTPGKYRAIRRS